MTVCAWDFSSKTTGSTTSKSTALTTWQPHLSTRVLKSVSSHLVRVRSTTLRTPGTTVHCNR